jgi:hypothetical protein
MKKFLLAGLIAVSLVALSQQHAAAWCKFGIGASFNCTYMSGGKHLSWNSEQPPPPGCCDHGGGPYGYMPPGFTTPTGLPSGSAGNPTPQAPAAAQTPMPPSHGAMADPSQWNYGQAYQTVGYSYQDASYGYGYGYYPYYSQAPSYWYGR